MDACMFITLMFNYILLHNGNKSTDRKSEARHHLEWPHGLFTGPAPLILWLTYALDVSCCVRQVSNVLMYALTQKCESENKCTKVYFSGCGVKLNQVPPQPPTSPTDCFLLSICLTGLHVRRMTIVRRPKKNRKQNKATDADLILLSLVRIVCPITFQLTKYISSYKFLVNT